jgi:hypothetical protein
MENVYTSREVAEKLKLSLRSIQVYAKTYNIGKKFGRDWSFTDADVEIIKEHQARGRGRPPLKKD